MQNKIISKRSLLLMIKESHRILTTKPSTMLYQVYKRYLKSQMNRRRNQLKLRNKAKRMEKFTKYIISNL